MKASKFLGHAKSLPWFDFVSPGFKQRFPCRLHSDQKDEVFGRSSSQVQIRSSHNEASLAVE